MSVLQQENIKPLVIAAGFGIRMGDSTTPKGLKTVNGRPIISWLLSDLATIPGLDPAALISNARYSTSYKNWLREWQTKNNAKEGIKVINNRIKKPEHRRGALGDLLYALDHLKWKDGDLLVLSSDTLYKGTLADFIHFATHTVASAGLVTMVYEAEPEKIKNRLGCVKMNGHNIESFSEKPEDPPPNSLAISPFYFYPSGLLHMVREYKDQGGNLDAPSFIIDWFLQNEVPVFGYRAAPSLDVGTVQDLDYAQLFVST